ncbi:MAG: enoyl-CoA hydratase/isomerase family protein [Bdellovibrionales bacterium]|nr:enoyl-CoA hydratase/isomerase family protein [Bdellovibrionales bacterium]
MEKSVLFSEEKIGERGLGVVQLNRPRALNALNLEMFEQLAERLLRWREDQSIACVVLLSGHEKAFCAGGDVKGLVEGLRKGPEGLDLAKRFFVFEYFVDYLIHAYPKPVLAWTQGLTMGGGIGISNGASHRVVVETSVFSMPEVNIGLFPDVGASFFLRDMPHDVGLFLGLTGYRLGPEDAMALGLSDYYLKDEWKRKVLADITRLPWVGERGHDVSLLDDYLNGVQRQRPAPSSSFVKELPAVMDLVDYKHVLEFDKAFSELKKSERLTAAYENYTRGCPLSKAITFRQLKTEPFPTLREAFLKEWHMAITSCENSNFVEGVRALLIDKDNQPNWIPADLSEVTEDQVDPYFNGAKNSASELDAMMKRHGI